MKGGCTLEPGKSTLVHSIAQSELVTRAKIRVHLSRRRYEFNLKKRAVSLFKGHQELSAGIEKNSVLIYANLRTHQFVILADQDTQNALKPQFWAHLSRLLTEELRSTYHENALAFIVSVLGFALQKPFPGDP